MKTIISVIALTLAPSWSASGKAYFFTRSELIQKASVIAIVTLEEPVKAKPAAGDAQDPFAEDSATGKNWVYWKQAEMHVEKVLKGTIPGDVILYGDESFICAQCTLSKGRFLAFLTKDGDLWVGANWQLSLRSIQDNEVEWYVSEDQRFPMKFQKMDDVVAQIQAALKKQQSEQAGAGQPATRSESKSDGNQSPKPESEGRSR